ncbi:Stk1 family PASTA domain-containing Ser/Thr kinase [Nocardioides acrostichi]|uniref:Stk1 family PASTA domain-containing Ser/Thr kinase n=1 Tax=Nocardioides acrostichi TaxID=2784339 RepID=UPI002E2C121F|nr:Stk1 family PASTA domain-containing Ser/Thr kinase [Nocardioides acrostichi]
MTDRQPYDGRPAPQSAHRARGGTTGRSADPSTRAPRSDPQTGRILDGRYRIGPRIARGGMASVYEAHDLRLQRTVAIKIMHVGLGDDEEFAARFVREARAAARLSHPNVVAVYDQGEDDGTVFLAMELVHGHTLRDTVTKEAPMSPARALALLDPVVSALASAHRAGLVHRDVKPENVLVADDGRIKVADFGLAKAVSTDTQHTATGGIVIGTVSYLAPELVAEGLCDARNDVYAVGVLLYELLTGAKPHEGESPIQVAYKHVHEDVPAPSERVSGLPPYVDALVARATARDRSQRPADAGVLLHQMHRVAQALTEGVDDEELTADLTPFVSAVAAMATTTPAADRLDTGPVERVDTAPEIWDTDEAAALIGPGEPTSRVRQVPPAAPTRPRAAAAAATPPPGTSPRPSGRRRWRGPLAAVLAVLLAAGIGLGAWWYGWARYDTLPSVLDQTRASAVKELEAAGYTVTFDDPAYSDTVKRNHVVTSSPGAGERVLSGAEVHLVMSRGVEKYPVPKVKGMTVDEATAALEQNNLAVGDTPGRYDADMPEGRVLHTDPKPGQKLRPDSAVDLVVSKGPKPINVGAWVGKPLERAQAVLERKGLTVTVNDAVFSDSVPEGRVVSQDPPGGTLFAGDTVTLTPSKGPELVEVPSVVRQGVDAATQTLKAAGFNVEIENSEVYVGLGYVLRQSPGGGDMAAPGSTIVLYLV